MYFLISSATFIVTYICLFKNDFTQETIDKVTPIFIFIGVILGLLILLSMLF